MTFAVADLRSYLLGHWRLKRILRDRGSGAEGALTGSVLFTADDDGLHQREEGTMVWSTSTGSTHTGLARRDYLLRPAGESGAMDVLFADGKLFHLLNLSAGSWSSGHWCAPDDYRVRYTARSPDRLDFEWEVSGPAKNQLLRSSLFRER